jgi:hypothetical protein
LISSPIRFAHRFVQRLFALSIAVWLVGCAALSPGPKSINLSEARLQQLIASQFPFHNRMLDILEVTLSSPRVSLDPAGNRINTGMDIGVASRGLGALLTQRDLRGAIDLSYGLRFEPSDNSVRMTDVRVARLDIPGAPSQFQSTFNKLGSALAEQVLRDYTLYKLKPEDLSAAKGWGYKPGAFSIGSNGLNLSLEPAPTK